MAGWLDCYERGEVTRLELVEALARLVREGREECAVLAETYLTTGLGGLKLTPTQQEIARAIRERNQEDFPTVNWSEI